MKIRLSEILLSSLVICLVQAAAPDTAMAKNYTYKYSETIKTSVPSGDREERAIIDRPVMEERVVSRPVIVKEVVERPVVVKRVIRRPVYVSRPLYVRRVVARPVLVKRVYDRPVYVRRVVEHPVVVKRYYQSPVVVEKDVIYKKKTKGIIPKVYGTIFGH